MIVIGGQFPLTKDCDSPGQWGTHNVDLGEQNPSKDILGPYSPSKTTYVVPEEILAVVGGNGNGSATNKTPANGFDYTDVSLLITRKADIPTRTPTRAVDAPTKPVPNKRLSTRAIVGIAVGTGILAIALALGCVLVGCNIRRQLINHRTSQSGPSHAYRAPSMSGAWSSPPCGHSSFSSSPPQASYQYSPPPMSEHILPPQVGSPVELPSESPQSAPAAMAGTSTLTHISSTVSYPPQRAYFPETATLMNQPHYDAQGNMWMPQVSMVQVMSRPTPPLPGYTPTRGDVKTTPQPASEPQSEPQELCAEPKNHSAASVEH